MKRYWLIIGLLLAGMAQAATGTKVVVNGKTLQAPTRMVNGALLLPMRAVFEALHAQVRWYPSLRQITAVRGDRTIQLWINQRTALVNDRETPLMVSPQLVAGATYVPLRFPAEALGGTVYWDGTVQTAYIDITALSTPVATVPTTTPPTTPPDTITTTTPPDNTTPPIAVTPPTPPEPEKGVVITTSRAGGPAITYLNEAGERAVLRLPDGVKLIRGLLTSKAHEVTLDELQPGDAVTLVKDADGRVTAVEANYLQVTGRVAGFANNTLLMKDGETYQLNPDARITDSASHSMAASEIVPGMDVTLTITPFTTMAWAAILPAPTPPPTQPTQPVLPIQPVTPVIEPVEPPPPVEPTVIIVTPPRPIVHPEIGRVSIPYNDKPLQAGDSVLIEVTGTPHADHVTARIGNAIRGIDLYEREAGVYSRRVTIPNNVNVVATSVYACMELDGEMTGEVRSREYLTIDTTAPSITTLLPRTGGRITDRDPYIEVTYDDQNGSGVARGSVQLWINGVEINHGLSVTTTRLTYQASKLPLGRNYFRVRLLDSSGNIADSTWSVTIYEPVPLRIVTVSHNATKPLVKDQTLTITAQIAGEPERVEWLLGTRVVSTSTSHTGDNYSMSYKIRAEDQPGSYPVSVKAYNGAQNQTGAATGEVVIVPEPRLTISEPTSRTKIGDSFTVAGGALAGARVRVTVTCNYRNKNKERKEAILYADTVTADAGNHWTTPAINTVIENALKVRFTIKAELLGADGAVLLSRDVEASAEKD